MHVNYTRQNQTGTFVCSLHFSLLFIHSFTHCSVCVKREEEEKGKEKASKRQKPDVGMCLTQLKSVVHVSHVSIEGSQLKIEITRIASE